MSWVWWLMLFASVLMGLWLGWAWWSYRNLVREMDAERRRYHPSIYRHQWTEDDL